MEADNTAPFEETAYTCVAYVLYGESVKGAAAAAANGRPGQQAAEFIIWVCVCVYCMGNRIDSRRQRADLVAAI